MHLLIKEAAVGAEGSFINIFTCNLVQVINPSIHYSTHSKALLLFNVNEKRPRVSKTFTFANVKVLAFDFTRDKLVPVEVIILFLFKAYQHFEKLSPSYQVYEQQLLKTVCTAPLSFCQAI